MRLLQTFRAVQIVLQMGNNYNAHETGKISPLPESFSKGLGFQWHNFATSKIEEFVAIRASPE